MIHQRIGRALSWVWLIGLIVACQGSASTTPPGQATPTVRQPTSIPTVQPTWPPTPTAQPSPTATAPAATATPVQPAAAFTLTILHTGQVYGETGPCG